MSRLTGFIVQKRIIDSDSDSEDDQESVPKKAGMETQGADDTATAQQGVDDINKTPVKDATFQSYLNEDDWKLPGKTVKGRKKGPNHVPAWMRGTRKAGKRSSKTTKKPSKKAKKENAAAETKKPRKGKGSSNPFADAPKRARSSYQFFVKEYCTNGKHTMEEAAAAWKTLSDDLKQPHEKAAAADKERFLKEAKAYAAEHPDWKGSKALSKKSAEDSSQEASTPSEADEASQSSSQDGRYDKDGADNDANDQLQQDSNNDGEGDGEGTQSPLEQEASESETSSTNAQSAMDTSQDDSENEQDKCDGAANNPKSSSSKKQEKRKSSFASFFAPRKASSSSKKVEKDEPEQREENQAASAETETPTTPPLASNATEATHAPADTSRLAMDYDPSSTRYDIIESACWGHGQPVPYKALAATFSKIEATTKRIEIISILANFLRSVLVLTPADLIPCIYLCTNDLAPAYEGIELGIGDAVLMKAIQIASGRSLKKIRADMATIGDLGEVAAASFGKQTKLSFRPKVAALTVNKVFKKFKDIALLKGQNSQNRKVDYIQSLLLGCKTPAESMYIIRALGGKLRIGLAELSVLSALGSAVTLTPCCQPFPPPIQNAGKGVHPDKLKKLKEEMTLKIKTVFCELPNYDKIIPIMLEEGVDAMAARCTITPGIPMKPMLAHPTKGVGEVMERFDGKTFVCEYKYDGERAQVHRDAGGNVSIFSRNSENNTTKYPDITSRIHEALSEDVTDFVIDCEAVAFDVETQQILPFQVLSTRKRKDADENEIQVQVCLFAFDLIYLNGKSYVKEPLEVRRDTLRSKFKHIQGQFHFADCLVTSEVDEIGEFLELSVKHSCEGLMVKTLQKDATYEIAKRSHSWLKLKKDYLDGVGDTLDLVVIGAWTGKGKRTGTYGAFLLACYDSETEEYQSICKIGTGFTDEDLKQHYAFLKEHVIRGPRNYYQYDSTLEPDHWFDPVQVWEVKAADLSISPRHKAAVGYVDANKGISLRFPRFMRIRDDKKPDMATNAQQVADMYNSQELIKNANSGSKPRYGPPS